MRGGRLNSVVSPFLLFLCSSALSYVRFLFFLSAPLPCPASLLRVVSAHAFSHTCSLVLTGSHELEASAFPIFLPLLLFPHLPSRTQQPKSTSAVLCSGRELSPGEPPGDVPGPPHQLTFHQRLLGALTRFLQASLSRYLALFSRK